MINLQMNGDYVALINESLELCGYSDRSAFIRDAIAEKLRDMGIEVPKTLPMAPGRVGKHDSGIVIPGLSKKVLRAADAIVADAVEQVTGGSGKAKRKRAPASRRGKARARGAGKGDRESGVS